MTALDIIREKKRIHGWGKLTAAEMCFWNQYWRGKENDNADDIALAETAAEEVAAKDARIEELRDMLGLKGKTT